MRHGGLPEGLEVSSADLYGTGLVVLSACETGVGDVGNAAGVYSLRRARALADSKTQVMTLWKVERNTAAWSWLLAVVLSLARRNPPRSRIS
jgi:hypothetical protein